VSRLMDDEKLEELEALHREQDSEYAARKSRANKIAILSHSGIIKKPKGWWSKRCPDCGEKLCEPFKYKLTQYFTGYLVYRHYECDCGYEFTK